MGWKEGGRSTAGIQKEPAEYLTFLETTKEKKIF
jgi:hypothetical protein